jgi:hypothetical protein
LRTLKEILSKLSDKIDACKTENRCEFTFEGILSCDEAKVVNHEFRKDDCQLFLSNSSIRSWSEEKVAFGASVWWVWSRICFQMMWKTHILHSRTIVTNQGCVHWELLKFTSLNQSKQSPHSNIRWPSWTDAQCRCLWTTSITSLLSRTSILSQQIRWTRQEHKSSIIRDEPTLSSSSNSRSWCKVSYPSLPGYVLLSDALSTIISDDEEASPILHCPPTSVCRAVVCDQLSRSQQSLMWFRSNTSEFPVIHNVTSPRIIE